MLRRGDAASSVGCHLTLPVRCWCSLAPSRGEEIRYTAQGLQHRLSTSPGPWLFDFPRQLERGFQVMQDQEAREGCPISWLSPVGERLLLALYCRAPLPVPN